MVWSMQNVIPLFWRNSPRRTRARSKFFKVNVDECQQLAVQFNIRSIPTLLFFKDGQVQEQVVGLKSESDLQASIDRLA